MVSKNLKDFEDLLPPAIFCRVHHSHIININFVKKYYKGRGGYVEMENGTTIEISVRKKEDFLNKFVH
jgi:two-component system LytT family response regulator